MSQNSLLLPTTGTVSGLQMTQNVNNALDTLNTLASGPSAPPSYEAGQLWHDTAANVIRMRSQDNSSWIALLNVNESNYAASASSPVSNGFVNKFRNAACDVQQRGTSGTVASGATLYTLDGYAVNVAGATVTWSYSQPGYNGSSGALLLSASSGLTNAIVYQRIESRMAAGLAGQNCTFQAAIYNATSSIITPTLTVFHASAVDSWGSPVNDLNLVPLQSCPSNAWTVVSYSFAVSASATAGLECVLSYGGSLNAASGGIATTAWDVRATPFVTPGLNASPPPPELRPTAIETVLCQRYFETSYLPGVAPGSAGQINAGDTQQAALNTNDFYTYRNSAVRFAAQKRAAPTMTLYGPSDGSSGPARFYDYNISAINGNAAVGNANINQFGVYSSTTLTAGHAYGIHWIASAEL